MQYDFDKIIDRRATNSMKWNVPEGELPMWVADMDFRTAPEIITAIKERAEYGIYGYKVSRGLNTDEVAEPNVKNIEK